MQGDSLQVKDWPRSMNRHLKECPACAKLARNLYKLEDAWRNQPIPEACNVAKASFLDKLASVTAAPAAPAPQVETKPAPEPETPQETPRAGGSGSGGSVTDNRAAAGPEPAETEG